MTFVRGHLRRTPSGRMTYVRPHHRRSTASLDPTPLVDPTSLVGPTPLVVLALIALLLVGMLVAWIVELIAAHIVAVWFTVVGLGALVGVVYFVVVGIQSVRARKVARYLDLCHELMRGSQLSSADKDALHALSRELPVDVQARVVGEERLFEGFVAQVLADGRIDEQEARVLAEVEGLFSIDVARAEMIKFAAFDALLGAFGELLDEEAEVAACEVALALGLPLEEVVAKLQPLVDRREQARRDARAAEARRDAARAAEARRDAARVAEARRHAARAAEAQLAYERREAARRAELERELQLAAEVLEADTLRAIEASVRLDKREQAFYEAPAVEIKRFKKGDRRQSGALVITDRRLLFVGDGNIAIPWAKLLDVAADCDEGLLRVIKDGRKTPYYFELDRPRIALAHVERGLAHGV